MLPTYNLQPPCFNIGEKMFHEKIFTKHRSLMFEYQRTHLRDYLTLFEEACLVVVGGGGYFYPLFVFP